MCHHKWGLCPHLIFTVRSSSLWSAPHPPLSPPASCHPLPSTQTFHLSVCPVNILSKLKALLTPTYNCSSKAKGTERNLRVTGAMLVSITSTLVSSRSMRLFMGSVQSDTMFYLTRANFVITAHSVIGSPSVLQRVLLNNGHEHFVKNQSSKPLLNINMTWVSFCSITGVEIRHMLAILTWITLHLWGTDNIRGD